MILRRRKQYFYFIILLLTAFLSFGQTTVIKGRITDAKSNEPIPFVVVQLAESNVATTSDVDGFYELRTNDLNLNQVKVNYIGFKPVLKSIVPGKEQTVNIRLSENVQELQEVVIRGKKGKYRNRDNPAVTFIRRVIDKKEQNRISNFEYYESEKYEKTQFAVSNVPEDIKKKKILKNYQFVFDNLDSSKLEGRPVLPFYLKENISNVLFRKSPRARKEIIKGTKTVTYKGYIDEDGLAAYMKYLYQDIDIYENNVFLFSNQFISPVAGLAPAFYQYYLADTLLIDSVNCVKVSFMPRNKNDFLFQGDLYITFDSAYAIKGVSMTVNPEINLNWVKELSIRQSFEKQPGGGYFLVKDELACDFGTRKNIKNGLFGERATSYRKIKINKPRPEEDYVGLETEIDEQAKELPDSFWNQSRHDTLTQKEKGIYATLDSVQKVKSFKRTMDIAVLLFAGYKSFKWFEIGPVNSFYSFNPVEGNRLRFGGRTTPELSKKLTVEGYGAYGFKDERLKYYIAGTWSLTKRTIWQFPVKSVRASYQYDTKVPGQDFQFFQENNFIGSFRRGVNDKYTYNGTYYIEYLNEFRNHFSINLGLRHWKQEPAGGLHFNRNSYSDHTSDIKLLTATEGVLTLRYAPNEIFYQGKVYRTPIINKNPVFTLRLASGFKGLLGGEYEYQNVILNVFKRFYLSQAGFTDVTLEAGKIFGKVPFPLLFIHRANQTYLYQAQSYNLMNFLEFVSDDYQSLNIDHNFNGFIFNKVPLLKMLKWREFAGVKILYGRVSDLNNPVNESDLFKFPVWEDGRPLTNSLEQKPYLEGGVGIGNIFKFFRVDLIKRFSYTNLPHVSRLGIRVRFKFDF